MLTAALGPAAYGAAGLVSTLSTLGATLGLRGVDLAYLRGGLDPDAGRRRAVEAFAWRRGAMGALLAGLAGAMAWLVVGGGLAPGRADYALWVAAAIFTSVAQTLAMVRRRLEGRYGLSAAAVTVSALATAAVSLGLALAGLKSGWALLAGFLAGPLASLILLRLPDPARLALAEPLEAGERRALAAMGQANLGTALVFWFLTSADRWFVAGLGGGVTAAGVYGVAATLGSAGLLINNSLTMSWFPEVSRHFEQEGSASAPAIGRLFAQSVTLIGVVWLAVTAGGGDGLRLVTAREFHAGAPIVPVMAGATFFYGLATLLNTNLFLARTMRPAVIGYGIAAVIFTLSALILTPRLGPLGAALSQMLAMAVVSLTIFLATQARAPLAAPWLRLLGALLVLLGAGVVMAPAWSGEPLVSLAAKAPCGLVATIFALALSAPDTGNALWARVRAAIRGLTG